MPSSSSLIFKNKMKVENIQIHANAFSDSMDMKVIMEQWSKTSVFG
jgi:hypothetical protein